MIVGYARTSVAGNLIEEQKITLLDVGCTKVYEDSSDDGTVRCVGLREAQIFLSKGDTLVICKLDRLGCGVKRFVSMLSDFHERGCQFRSLEDSIDSRTASGATFYHLIRRFAEMERNLTRERTRPGLQMARRLGRTGGRKTQMTEANLRLAKKELAKGIPFPAVAATLGISIATLYRWIPASNLGAENTGPLRKHKSSTPRHDVSLKR